MPSVEAARPAECHGCSAPSRRPGHALGLHGHGVRERQVRGPLDVAAPPGTVVVRVRRYRCTGCGAVLTVVPRGVAACRHYGHAAIAMALALWAIVGQPVKRVRQRVCAWQIGDELARDWSALRRWARAAGVRLGLATPIAAAARAAQIAMGLAPPTLRGASIEALAFAGGRAMP